MLDAYTRRAWLSPAALAAVPALALIAIGAVAPQEAGSATALVVGAVGMVICGLVRDVGRKLEADLWASWRGPPTTRRLRWTGAVDAGAVERLHRHLDALLDEPLPTREEESADPTDADRRYHEAIAILREWTRDRERFPLVFEENVEYGFRRNCLGVRPIALSVAVGGLAISSLLLVLADSSMSEHAVRYGLSATAAVVAGLVWWRLVTPAWVRRAAELYADRLLEAIASLRRDG